MRCVDNPRAVEAITAAMAVPARSGLFNDVERRGDISSEKVREFSQVAPIRPRVRREIHIMLANPAVCGVSDIRRLVGMCCRNKSLLNGVRHPPQKLIAS